MSDFFHLQPGRFLWESAEPLNFSQMIKEGGEQFVVAYHSQQKIPVGKAVFLDYPENYFSEERFREFMDKKHFTDAEVSFCAKILLWKESFQNPLERNKGNIALHGDENRLWPFVSHKKDDKNVWKDADFSFGKIVMASHQFLLSHMNAIPCGTLIVEDALTLEENLTNALQKKFYWEVFETPLQILSDEMPEKRKEAEAFGARLEILFGLLGMYFEHRDEGGGWDIVLDDFFPSSLEGRKIHDSLKNLQEETERFEREQKPFFTPLALSAWEIFSSSLKEFTLTLTLTDWKKNGWVAWLSFYKEKISLTAAPLFLGKYLQPIFENPKIKTIALKDSALFLKNERENSFLQEIFSLDDTWKIFSDNASNFITPEIPQNLPEPNTEGYFNTCENILKLAMRESGGNMLAIFHTKKAVEAFHNALLPETMKCDIKLISQGMSGGLGKIVDLFLRDPDHSILFGTAILMNFFEKFQDALHCIVFQKLPFDFSTNPLGKIRPSAFSDGFERYTQRKALLKFKRFLIDCSQKTGGKKPAKIILLDTRFVSREYHKLL